MLIASLYAKDKGGRFEPIGVVHVSNDGTGTTETGNYEVRCGTDEGRVEGFERERGAWALLTESIAALQNGETDGA